MSESYNRSQILRIPVNCLSLSVCRPCPSYKASRRKEITAPNNPAAPPSTTRNATC